MLHAERMQPILVVSGFVDKNDFRLLQEYSCTMLMEKPFTKSMFESKVEALVNEWEWNNRARRNHVSRRQFPRPEGRALRAGSRAARRGSRVSSVTCALAS